MKSIHQQNSPFPFETKTGRRIHDEKCSCGHLRSDHCDTLAYGHGACGFGAIGKFHKLVVDMEGKAPTCGCRKFTWVSFVENAA